MAATLDVITATLTQITDPTTGASLMAGPVVKALNVDAGVVKFVMEIDPKAAETYAGVKAKAEAALRKIAGVTQVSIVMTGHAAPPPDLKPKKPAAAAPAGPAKIPGVDRVVAIASGKGGVGKSTLSANLACALAQQGRRVGLLDADVYGPSQPRMMGMSGRPGSPDGKIIIPKQAHGVTAMSIGLMMEDGQAIVWRGPMLMGALQQMLMQVQWGQLDVLLIDLPPGTGDIQLTLCQRTKLTGAIVVSTPQDVALLDAKKALSMFDTLNTPVLGLIENMSTYVCPKCGHEAHPFGHGGVEKAAKELDLPFLGALPLSLDVRLGGDAGKPVAAGDGAEAKAYLRLAERLIKGGMG